MTGTTAEPTLAPVSKARRILALDVLRGIAILGTLLTNIWIFSGSVVNEVPEVDGFLGSFNRVSGTVLNLFTDGKFIGLLTIMFGIGLEIQRQSAIRRGEPWPGRYPWRALVLILDGLLNYIFIFEFDVLMGYGLTALVVAAVMARSPRAQKIWMYIGLGAHLFFIALSFSGTWLLGKLMPDFADAGERGSDIVEPGRDVFIAPSTTDSYWEMVGDRLSNFLGGRGEIPIMFVMGLGLFLVGAHLYRAGLFLPESVRLRRIVMAVGFGIGIPLDWTLRLTEFGAGYATRYGTSPLVAFGLLAAVAAFYANRDKLGLSGKWLSLVGRMALTCYILQNLIASIIFYDWGFGVAAKIQGQWYTLATLGIYVGISAFLIALSAVWLHYFRRGPVELLWHRGVDAIADAADAAKERRRGRREAAKPVG